MKKHVIFCLIFLFFSQNPVITEDKGSEQYKPIAIIKSSEINESSGIIKSKKHKGIYWTHNDSGDTNRIFAIKADGTLVATYQIKGAEAKDWEDIAIDNTGNLYIGDIGNNNKKRQDLMIYMVNEPDTLNPTGGLDIIKTIKVNYGETNYDCESLCLTPEGKILLITKNPSPANIFAYNGKTWDKIQELKISNLATGADINQQGDLIISTYIGFYIFKWNKIRRQYTPEKHVYYVQKQCEAVCWDNTDLIFTNEQKDIFKINPAVIKTGEKYFYQHKWKPKDKNFVYLPVNEFNKIIKNYNFQFQFNRDNTVSIYLIFKDTKKSGRASFLFSTKEPMLRITTDESDVDLRVSISANRVIARFFTLTKPNKVFKLTEPEIIKHENYLEIKIEKAFFEKQKSFAAHFMGFNEKPSGWPYPKYTIMGRPFAWAKRIE